MIYHLELSGVRIIERGEEDLRETEAFENVSHREDSLPRQVDIEEREVDRLGQRQTRRCVELCRRADDIATELFQQVDQLESHGGIVLGEKHPHPLKLPWLSS